MENRLPKKIKLPGGKNRPRGLSLIDDDDDDDDDI